MNAGVVEEAENQLESVDGPGRRLQQARLAGKLELSRVAAQLHLSVEMVEALERDDYSRLPDAVFVRGYIINYARLLGLPPEQLTAAYNARLPDGAVRALGRVRMKDGIGGGHRPGRTLGLLLIIGLGILAVFWAKSRLDAPEFGSPETVAGTTDRARLVERVAEEPGELTPSRAADSSGRVLRDGSVTGQQAPESLELVTAALAESAVEAGSPQPISGREQPSLPDEVALAEPPWPGSVIEPVPAEVESPDGAGSVVPQPGVILELLGPCWVDIRDADGKNKIIGELQKGVQKVIRGEPPFSVVLGNSRAVRLLVNGKPYDVGQHAQGNVARFKLDPRDQGG